MNLKMLAMSALVTVGTLGPITVHAATTSGQNSIQSPSAEEGNSTSPSHFPKHHHRHHHHEKLIREVSDIVKMDPNDVRRELKSGKSLSDIAASKGVSETALTAQLRANLQARVKKMEANGKLSSVRAQRIMANFDAEIATKLHHRKHSEEHQPQAQ